MQTTRGAWDPGYKGKVMRPSPTPTPLPVPPAMAISEAIVLDVVPALVECAFTVARQAFRVFGLPFDTARALYARAVQTGLVPNSILAWRDVEVALDAMETVTLGPLARRV